MVEYKEQSREHYKGFDLVIELYNLDSNNPLRMHRRCTMFYNGTSIAASKTKKELKELIDAGLYDKYKTLSH